MLPTDVHTYLHTYTCANLNTDSPKWWWHKYALTWKDWTHAHRDGIWPCTDMLLDDQEREHGWRLSYSEDYNAPSRAWLSLCQPRAELFFAGAQETRTVHWGTSSNLPSDGRSTCELRCHDQFPILGIRPTGTSKRNSWFIDRRTSGLAGRHFNHWLDAESHTLGAGELGCLHSDVFGETRGRVTVEQDHLLSLPCPLVCFCGGCFFLFLVFSIKHMNNKMAYAPLMHPWPADVLPRLKGSGVTRLWNHSLKRWATAREKLLSWNTRPFCAFVKIIAYRLTFCSKTRQACVEILTSLVYAILPCWGCHGICGLWLLALLQACIVAS